MRRRTGSCVSMMVRERRGRTHICWWTICGGWSGECLAFDTVQLRDLERYMGIVGAEVRMPLGEPCRVGKRPYGRSALSTAAACLKGFYLHQSSLGVNGELGRKLGKSRLPSRMDRRRSFLGHVVVAAHQPAGPEGAAPPASEDAPGRRPGEALRSAPSVPGTKAPGSVFFAAWRRSSAAPPRNHQRRQIPLGSIVHHDR
jgi:hypothetical protein